MTIRERLKSSLRRPPGGPADNQLTGAVEALRESWSLYPGEWKQDAKLNLGFTTLGEEWGGPAFADYIADLVSPYLGPDVDVLELGCGGGKFSQRLAPKCRSLICTDISPQMIEHTKESLSSLGLDANVSYRVLNGAEFDGIPSNSVDFVFSYDVQLHLQAQNVFSYMQDGRRVLRDNGVFMLHQINLASEGGMAHFLGQYSGDTWKRDFADPRRRGHIYFMSEEQMVALATHAALAMERIVADDGEFHTVSWGRDLIGFMRKRPSRLGVKDPREVPLVKLVHDDVVYAVIDGRRHAFASAAQFERRGFRWEEVREVSEGELASIEDGGALQPWE
jgi:2-polyprenyl-3-methyl-5-hydroxy-6-metoxy-1,4-benzoquinol methylase